MGMVNEKIKIGKKEISTRIVMPPIATYQSTDDGMVTEKMLDYYGERAANRHTGMVITEHSYIDIGGKAKKNQMSIEKNDDIAGLSKLVDTIHQRGVLAIAQLNHAGSAAPSGVTGRKAVSASRVILPTVPMMGDGVEIHSAHAYLLNQFFSPLTNHRNDEYGGSIDGRLKIHREVIQAVREATGEDMVVSIRLGGCDYVEGGSTISDCVYAAKVFERAGVDMIDISGGMCRYTRKGHDEPGYFQDMSLEVKKASSIPVMLTGGVKTLEDAERLLSMGVADLIGVGRELLKNPQWEE